MKWNRIALACKRFHGQTLLWLLIFVILEKSLVGVTNAEKPSRNLSSQLTTARPMMLSCKSTLEIYKTHMTHAATTIQAKTHETNISVSVK